MILYWAIQRVQINIVHGNITNFLKSGLGKEIKFYISFKYWSYMSLYAEKMNKIHLRKLEISLIW